jgi:hypothetical protein
MPHSIDLGNYEKVPILEETWPPKVPPSSSSEEDDDSTPMLKDENPMIAAKRSILPWPRHPIRWVRSPFMFLLDLVLVMLVVIFSTRKPAILESTNAELQGDIHGLVPNFEPQLVVFKAYPEFVSNHTSEASLREAREYWMKLLPRESTFKNVIEIMNTTNILTVAGQGYVKVDDDDIQMYALPNPVQYKGGKSVGTSMMHGLHCLVSLRDNPISYQSRPLTISSVHDYVRI